MASKNNNLDERDLAGRKWYDYRPVPASVATMVFLRDYGHAFRSFAKKAFGNSYINPFVGLDLTQIESWKHFKLFNFLRQWSDFHSLKYPDFWRFAFEAKISMRMTHPTPNTFKNEALLRQVLDAEVRSRDEMIRFADAPIFHPSRWQGLHLQNEYYRYIVEEVGLRYPGHHKEKLDILVGEGVVPCAFLRKYYPRLAA